MSELAFAPVSDHDDAPTNEDVSPNLVLSRAVVKDAVSAGFWSHDEPAIAAWLNGAFPVGMVPPTALEDHLALHGIAVTP